MCIRCKQLFSRFAEEDIVCYKVMISTEVEYVYKTPFRETIVGSQQIKDGKPFVAYGTRSTEQSYEGGFVISEGFIHTFQDIESAIYLCDRINRFWDTDYPACVFVCEIPRGTFYLGGYDNNYCKCFASEQIVFKEKLTGY